MSAPENPCAFPASTDGYGNFLKGTPGMTLRDWFAGQALTGVSAGLYSGSELTASIAATLAGEAYMLADAMLAARSGADA